MTLIPKAEAHILYIADQEAVEEFSGTDSQLIAEPFHHTENILLMLATVIIVAFIILAFRKIPGIKKKLVSIVHKAVSYYELTPWMMRLSLGIALIGAGTHEWLVTPALTGFHSFAFLQMLLGFFLLAGFATSITSIASIVLFLFALTHNFYLLGSFEFLAMSLALVIMDARKPGLDDVLGIEDIKFPKLKKWVPVILRIGVGVSLVFLALYEKFLNPDLAAHVIQITHLQNVINVSPQMWVVSSGMIEMFLGLMLIVGFWTRAVSAVTFLVLSLTFFYFGENVVSHITLFGILSVLFVMGGKRLK